MIFATDLDRTLIYSEKFLEDFKGEVLNIEIYKDKPISYISIKALKLLKELDEVATIIPVTTRNSEQYHRIKLFSDPTQNGVAAQCITPRCYVINNGGTIFYEGQEDLEWTHKIQSSIEALELSYEEVLKIFLELYKGPVERYKKSDELIWLVLGDADQIDEEGIKAFEKQVTQSGWKIDVNGRKIYLYPEFVNKWAAIDYIRNKYFKESVMAAGDSLFDYEMIHKATYGGVPKEAWIEADCRADIFKSTHSGLMAAEELLQYALKKVEADQ